MLFRQMKYFTAVVESGSFTEAAERCFISQSAVSQQIAALEVDLGVRLLIREGRKFRLTPAGESFYGRCRAILQSVEEARAEAVRLGSDGELTLNIGYLAGYDGPELQSALVAFSREYPEVNVGVFRGTHEELYRAVRSGEANLVLSDQRRAFCEEYENFVLAQCPARIDVLPAVLPAPQETVTVLALESTPCILVAEKGEEETERRFYTEMFGLRSPCLFAASLDEARLMAMSGRGFLLVESARPQAAAPLTRLELRHADGSAIVRTYCAFWQKRRSNYYVEEFASNLRAEYARQ